MTIYVHFPLKPGLWAFYSIRAKNTLGSRMYINILLDTVLATDVNKYYLAFSRCQQRWRTHLANWIYF